VFYRKYVKRILGILLSVIALPFLGVIFIFVAPAIWLEDHGTIFYKAPRRGLNGKTFLMYKFRSMIMDAPDLRNSDNTTFNSSTDARVTKVGRFLRKTSLDEIPQVLNILKGDMSWIGPRPSIPRQGYTWADLDENQKKKLTVRPGVTGYTAALYRNSISRDEKLKKDCYYADHINFVLDLKIVFWTLKAVFLRKNIYRN
jgi:lipopolysaccharide/colanic/teichoic acid biosynthesis glycosyltransferase